MAKGVKPVTLKVKVDPEAKEKAELIYGNLGMTLDEAVNIFLHKSVMENGLPFTVQQTGYDPVCNVPVNTASAPVSAAPAAANPAAATSAPAAAEQANINQGGTVQ